mgnify:CR=1 FL=1
MKNNFKKFTFLLTILSFTLLSSSAWGQKLRVRASGDIVEQDRNVSGFTALAVEDGIDVYVALGNSTKVIVKTHEDIQGKIKTEVRNNTLEIEVDGSIWQAKEMSVYVTMPDLERISTSGGSDVYSQGTLNLDLLEIYTSGGSDVKLEVNAQELRCKSSGGSDIYLRGTVDLLLAKASGGSDIKAKELTAKKCEVKTSGGSDAWVHVTEEIEMEASGASDIHYSGNPRVAYQRSSGASDIHGN